jgi:hypothetical protein
VLLPITALKRASDAWDRGLTLTESHPHNGRADGTKAKDIHSGIGRCCARTGHRARHSHPAEQRDELVAPNPMESMGCLYRKLGSTIMVMKSA